jgi:putative Ca2+/H+ antiporter (TMEM165/GDT1 family)
MIEIVSKSFLLVAATEMGDKTQLLAFILASRFKKPWTIMAGILTATISNHLLAAYFGSWISKTLDPMYLKWILIATFVGFAVWILIPDKDEELSSQPRYGAFITTLVTFFLAEMGDKTQLSTVALSAEYKDVFSVTMGTTLGMIFSDGLAVFLGEKITRIISMKWIHIFSSLLYLIFALKIYFSS